MKMSKFVNTSNQNSALLSRLSNNKFEKGGISAFTGEKIIPLAFLVQFLHNVENSLPNSTKNVDNGVQTR